MNENQKTILSYILCFFLGVAITLATTLPIYVSVSGRANKESGELSVRLSETSRGLSEATTTIKSLRESAKRISDAARESDGSLTSIIQSLRIIRDEVQVMEERLYSYDNSSGDNDSFDSLHVETVE